MGVNPELMRLALTRLAIEKRADPGAPMGGPPGAPMGAPPPAPAPGQAPPPGDPTMAGQAPPMQLPGGAPIAQPQPQQQGAAAGQKPKFDPLMLDYRMYNMQQLMTAVANQLGVKIPAEALIMPPGSMGAPPAEAALPGMGSPADQATQPGGGGPLGGGGAAAPPGADPMGQSQVQPIGGMPAAGAPHHHHKTASAMEFGAQIGRRASLLETLMAEPEKSASFIGEAVERPIQTTAAAVAALYRSKARNAA